jgi:hypothetical protein
MLPFSLDPLWGRHPPVKSDRHMEKEAWDLCFNMGVISRNEYVTWLLGWLGLDRWPVPYNIILSEN